MELFVECHYCRWRSRTLYRSAAVYEPSTLCCVWCKCCNSHCGFCLSCLLWISFPVVWPSVLWRCWLGGRKGIRPVKNLSDVVLAWLSVWNEVQTCIWPGWYHCHSLSLASVKSRLVLPFWYRLSWVVLDKWPLNGCVCVVWPDGVIVRAWSKIHRFCQCESFH